jgi:hypothetical protein
MFIIQYLEKKKNDLKSEAYAPLFNNRKDINVYKYVKLRNKIEFLLNRKNRYFYIGFIILFVLLYYSFIFWIISLGGNKIETLLIAFSFLPTYLLDLVDTYSFYIFDFDEPIKKNQTEKSLSSKLTRIAQKVFDDLVGRTKEIPVGNQ